MGLVLQLVETCADGGARSIELMELGRPGNLRDIADLGLTLPEAKQLLTCVQQAVIAVQARDHATLRPDCASCGERFRLKDWRFRRVATLFGKVVVRLPRFRCTISCTEGSGQTSSTFQGRKLFIMPSSESPPVPHAEPVRTSPGRAPSCRILEAKCGEFATFGARVSQDAISQFR